MGCDIHLHTEVKIDGIWHHMGNPSIPRYYDLFAKIAGVRGDAEPVNFKAGIPDDATFLTKIDYQHEGSDAHTPVTLDEKFIREVCQWYEINSENHRCLEFHAGYLFGNDWSAQKISGTDKQVEAVRWIAWFDN